jgi:hypothetical protein
MQYVFDLPSETEPNYTDIDHRCQRLLLLSGTSRNKCFDWCHPNCPIKAEEELWDIFKE